MKTGTKRPKQKKIAASSDAKTTRIWSWLIITCGLAGMLLFAFGVPMIALRLRDQSQLSVITTGERENVTMNFMEVEQLETREKLYYVSQSVENGEKLYMITTNQTMTTDERVALLQKIVDRNGEALELWQAIMQDSLMEVSDYRKMEDPVKYVVLDADANYLFSVYYIVITGEEDRTIQLVADCDDGVIYWGYFNGKFDTATWQDIVASNGYEQLDTWIIDGLYGGLGSGIVFSIAEDIYDTIELSYDLNIMENGGFHYEETENTGQDGEEAPLYFSVDLSFYDTFQTDKDDDSDIYSGFILQYGFPDVAELIETAYGDINLESYDAETNAEALLRTE